jgi:predicted short-subunit dehydrogenase-like oxidoreductase (DUF2520 family)
MEIVFVGAGRLATNLACALQGKGHCIKAVYSRTVASAQMLAEQVGSMATDRISELPLQADAFIIAIKDDAVSSLLPILVRGREHCCFFHTSGSIPMSVFDGLGIDHYGVVYPMQTFSKSREVDFSKVPFFLEAYDEQVMSLANQIARTLSSNVFELPSEVRRQLHLSAVFACNFVNHCYDLSSQLLEECGLPFSVMHALIEETFRKALEMHPHDAQTGPAIRYDRQVIDMQSRMLADHPLMQEVYDVMSRSIHHCHQPK